MSQQKEYEQKIQLLMHQLMEGAGVGGGANTNNNNMANGDPALEQR